MGHSTITFWDMWVCDVTIIEQCCWFRKILREVRRCLCAPFNRSIRLACASFLSLTRSSAWATKRQDVYALLCVGKRKDFLKHVFIGAQSEQFHQTGIYIYLHCVVLKWLLCEWLDVRAIRQLYRYITEVILDTELNIAGYNILRCDSLSRHTGGTHNPLDLHKLWISTPELRQTLTPQLT